MRPSSRASREAAASNVLSVVSQPPLGTGCTHDEHRGWICLPGKAFDKIRAGRAIEKR